MRSYILVRLDEGDDVASVSLMKMSPKGFEARIAHEGERHGLASSLWELVCELTMCAAIAAFALLVAWFYRDRSATHADLPLGKTQMEGCRGEEGSVEFRRSEKVGYLCRSSTSRKQRPPFPDE
jgi:hypothetical protein